VTRDGEMEVFQSSEKNLFMVNFVNSWPIDHHFCMELTHYFNGVYEMNPPPASAIAKDWLNTSNAAGGPDIPITSRGPFITSRYESFVNFL
jgi:hypothetical protein